MTRILPGVIAMAAVVVASNVLVQFLLLDGLLTWGAFTYPIAFLVTDLMNRFYGAAAARRVVLAGFVTGVACSLIGSQIMLEFGPPKFISKTDKQLISLRPGGQKCYNQGAVRRVLAGSGRRRDQVAPGWFCSGRGNCAFRRGRCVSGCAPAATGRCADWRFAPWPSAAYA